MSASGLPPTSRAAQAEIRDVRYGTYEGERRGRAAAVLSLARWGALATVGVVLYTLVDGPGTTATAEPRHGLLLALAAALVLLSSAWTVAEAPSRRRVAPKTYTPPPAPAPLVGSDDERWGPPQF